MFVPGLSIIFKNDSKLVCSATFKMDSFDWKHNTRSRLDAVKKSSEQWSDTLRSLSIGNHFISPIYNIPNVLIQIAETVRRGIDAVFDSLEIKPGMFREFLKTSVSQDQKQTKGLILKLFMYGSHTDLFPDELAYIKYIKSSHPFLELFSDQDCACGECSHSVRISMLSRWVRIRPQSTLNSELNTRQNQAISIDTVGNIGIRALSTENWGNIISRAHRTLVLDIPQSVRNFDLIGWNHGTMSIALDLEMLLELFHEFRLISEDISVGILPGTADDYTFEDVPVLMRPDEYAEAVDLVDSSHIDEIDSICAICLNDIEVSDSNQNLDKICVKLNCCNKIFHDMCLRHVLCTIGPPKCPLCRRDVREIK